MANDACYGVGFSRLVTRVTDVLRVLWRQVTIVLRVQQVQELSGLSLHHHVGRIGVARAHRVDDLVARAEWHRLVPTAM